MTFFNSSASSRPFARGLAVDSRDYREQLDDMSRAVNRLRRPFIQTTRPRYSAGVAALGQNVAVSSFPTFDPAAPSLVFLVRHPNFIGDPAEEFAAIGFLDLFGSARDGFTYTYTDINTRTADDGVDQITEELTQRIVIGDSVIVNDISIVNEEPPSSGNYVTNEFAMWWKPGQMWASETILGAGLGP